MEAAGKINIQRANCDRRSSVDRRIINLGPTYPLRERRLMGERRRYGLERRRYGWLRTSRWRSAPLKPTVP